MVRPNYTLFDLFILFDMKVGIDMKKKIGDLTLKEVAMNVVRCDNRKSVYCDSCVLKNESSCYSLKRQIIRIVQQNREIEVEDDDKN